MLWFSSHEACVILVSQPRIKSAPSEMEGEVLTSGPPGKSQQINNNKQIYMNN